MKLLLMVQHVYLYFYWELVQVLSILIDELLGPSKDVWKENKYICASFAKFKNWKKLLN